VSVVVLRLMSSRLSTPVATYDPREIEQTLFTKVICKVTLSSPSLSPSIPPSFIGTQSKENVIKSQYEILKLSI
jgi:hypothetical protein